MGRRQDRQVWRGQSFELVLLRLSLGRENIFACIILTFLYDQSEAIRNLTWRYIVCQLICFALLLHFCTYQVDTIRQWFCLGFVHVSPPNSFKPERVVFTCIKSWKKAAFTSAGWDRARQLVVATADGRELFCPQAPIQLAGAHNVRATDSLDTFYILFTWQTKEVIIPWFIIIIKIIWQIVFSGSHTAHRRPQCAYNHLRFLLIPQLSNIWPGCQGSSQNITEAIRLQKWQSFKWTVFGLVVCQLLYILSTNDGK